MRHEPTPEATPRHVWQSGAGVWFRVGLRGRLMIEGFSGMRTVGGARDRSIESCIRLFVFTSLQRKVLQSARYH